MTLVMRRDVQSAPSGLANSRSPASPTPSAHRTGDPTARSRSRSSTSSSGAVRLASDAATDPAGPAPTTRTSTSGIRDHSEGADRTGADTLLATGTRLAIDRKRVRCEVNRFRRAHRKAEPAAIAHCKVYDSD